MTGEGFAVTANGFDINANRPFGDDAGNGLFAVTDIKLEPPLYPPKGGKGRREGRRGRRQSRGTALREREFGFAVGTEGERGLLGDAIGLLKSLAKKQIGIGALLATLFVLETQGFFSSPIRKGSHSRLKFFRSDVGEII